MKEHIFRNKEQIISKFLLFLVSILFLSFVAVSTSPLTEFYGWDSSYFMLVGQGIAKDMVPYRDFFDMKGPFLYFIEYLSQLLCWGRAGCFWMEVFHLTISLWITDEIYRLASSRKYTVLRWLCFLPVLFVASFSFEHGNLTEEYSLPWLLFSVYLVCRYIKNAEATGNYEHPLLMGFYHGVAFGIMAMIRINNAAFIGAILLSVTIGLITSKQFLNILQNGCVFLLGTAAAVLPFFLWYFAKGQLSEMLNQVFLFGVQYSSQTGIIPKLYMMYNIRYLHLPAVLPLLVAIIYRIRSWRTWLLSLAALLLGAVAINMGFGLIHYIALLIPNLVFGLYLWLGCCYKTAAEESNCCRRTKYSIIVLFLCAMCVLMLRNPDVIGTYQHKVSTFTGKEWDVWGKSQVDEIVSQIPPDEQDHVYAYGTGISCSRWYVMAGLFPPIRYCDWQQSYINMRPEIGNELADWLKQDGIWLVTDKNYTFTPQQIADVVAENYTEYFSNESYTLYRIIE